MNYLTPEQREFIEHNRPHYDTLIRAEFLTNISQQVKDGMLDVARIFSPGMVVNLWCGSCICDLVRYVYTQVDKLPKEDVHFATFPKHDEPKRRAGNQSHEKSN